MYWSEEREVVTESDTLNGVATEIDEFFQFEASWVDA